MHTGCLLTTIGGSGRPGELENDVQRTALPDGLPTAVMQKMGIIPAARANNMERRRSGLATAMLGNPCQPLYQDRQRAEWDFGMRPT